MSLSSIISYIWLLEYTGVIVCEDLISVIYISFSLFVIKSLLVGSAWIVTYPILR